MLALTRPSITSFATLGYTNKYNEIKSNAVPSKRDVCVKQAALHASRDIALLLQQFFSLEWLGYFQVPPQPTGSASTFVKKIKQEEGKGSTGRHRRPGRSNSTCGNWSALAVHLTYQFLHWYSTKLLINSQPNLRHNSRVTYRPGLTFNFWKVSDS